MPTRTFPSHLHWRAISLVAIGGTFGAAARAGLSLVIPKLGGVGVSIAAINVVGAFLLGFLYESLTRDGIGPDHSRRLRLLLGTGFCGGFTTYSTLATETVVLTNNGQVISAVLYATGTVVFGAAATWAGIVLGARLAERSTTGGPR